MSRRIECHPHSDLECIEQMKDRSDVAVLATAGEIGFREPFEHPTKCAAMAANTVDFDAGGTDHQPEAVDYLW